jgi:hypothetical protein
MRTDSIRSVKNICWLLLIAICVIHAWFDGRNGMLMMKLQRQGASLASAREQIYWLCAPLNIATIIVLVLTVVLSIKEKWSKSASRLGRKQIQPESRS